MGLPGGQDSGQPGDYGGLHLEGEVVGEGEAQVSGAQLQPGQPRHAHCHAHTQAHARHQEHDQLGSKNIYSATEKIFLYR